MAVFRFKGGPLVGFFLLRSLDRYGKPFINFLRYILYIDNIMGINVVTAKFNKFHFFTLFCMSKF
jgi:hypothetical protein